MVCDFQVTLSIFGIPIRTNLQMVKIKFANKITGTKESGKNKNTNHKDVRIVCTSNLKKKIF